jgi:hypothetical protein
MWAMKELLVHLELLTQEVELILVMHQRVILEGLLYMLETEIAEPLLIARPSIQEVVMVEHLQELLVIQLVAQGLAQQ